MTEVSASILPPDAPTIPSFQRTGRRVWSLDRALEMLCRGAAILILLMLAALVAVLLRASLPAMHQFGVRFLYTTEWRANELQVPQRDAAGKIKFDEDNEMIVDIKPPTFGAATVIWGTALSSAIALGLAIPLSLGAALFLVRIAPSWLRPVTSFLVEFLAAIPSIAYGIWGLFVLAPFLQGGAKVPAMLSWIHSIPLLGRLTYEAPGYATAGQGGPAVYFLGLEPLLYHLFGSWPLVGSLFYHNGGKVAFTGRDLLCGGLILGIMVLPIITAISRDVLSAVPIAQVEGTLALGATWWQSAKQMLVYSRAGLFGAVMLGLARAAGETMAVTMVIGNVNQIVPTPFLPAQTMASLLANQFNEASDLQRSALTYVALILLLMSLLFNMVARYLVVGKNSRSSAAH